MKLLKWELTKEGALELFKRLDTWMLLSSIALLALINVAFGRETLLSVLAEFGVFLIITLSLNIEVGMTGIPQFGRVLAVTAGAFMVGGLAGRTVAWILGFTYGAEYADYKVNPLIMLEINRLLAANPLMCVGIYVLYFLLAAAGGAAIGWLVSRPAIRLKEAYLGISLLAFGDLLYWIGYNWEPLVGGSIGVDTPDPLSPVAGPGRFVVATSVMVIIGVLAFFAVEALSRSPFGRSLRTLRDCEVAASVYGKDIVKVRTLSLVVASALAGIAGALWTTYRPRCFAGEFTRLTFTFWPWAYMMLGGTGSNIGVALGVLLFIIIKTLIMIPVKLPVVARLLPFEPVWVEYLLCGLALVLIVLFRPYGLVPERPRTTLPREKIGEMLRAVKERGSEGAG